MISTVNQIPAAASLPFLGSGLAIYRQGLQDFAVKNWQELGNIFRAKLISTEYVFLAGPTANAFFSMHEQNFFTSKEVWKTFELEAQSNKLLATLDGKEHRRLRRIVKKPYSKQAIEKKWDECWAITDKFLSENENQNKPIFPMMQELVCEQIGLLALNSSALNHLQDLSTFITVILGVTTGVYPKLMLKMPPYLGAKKRVLTLAKQIVAEHRILKRQDPDVMDYFMEAMETDPDLIQEKDLLLLAIGPYIAGIDTAASSLSFILYAMTKHGVQERVKRELLALDDYSATKVQKSPILQALIAETMRKYVTAPAIPRTAKMDFEFEGYHIPEGQRLMLASGVVHYADSIYPNPNDFILDRCLPPRMEHRQKGAWVPFGIGSHTCAGAGFAMVQIAATITCLLSKWTVHTNNQLELTSGGAVFPTKKLKGGWKRDIE